jgi:hypothetical protein
MVRMGLRFGTTVTPLSLNLVAIGGIEDGLSLIYNVS